MMNHVLRIERRLAVAGVGRLDPPGPARAWVVLDCVQDVEGERVSAMRAENGRNAAVRRRRPDHP